MKIKEKEERKKRNQINKLNLNKISSLLFSSCCSVVINQKLYTYIQIQLREKVLALAQIESALK